MNDPSIPDTIGPYRILRRLGRGGMGEVFLAHDPRLDREVAIKRLIGIDETRRGRFRREARLAAGLNHPAIVQVFDLLNENGNEHIVMEYVPGTTLRAYAERSQVPLAEMLAICAEIAEALAYAHRRGVIHRDLKTENVLLTEDRRPKIADFGIARRDDTDGIDTSGFTATGALIGTARIMSPEQARGETIDLRSDVFSFGVLIYEVMTSTSPFLGANEVATVVRVISERHLPLIDAAPNMPRDLSRLVDELMAKDPDQRPSDVATLAPRLRALAQEASGLLVGGAKRRAAPPSVVTPPPPAAVVVPATDEPPTDAFQATGRRTAEGRATGPRLTRNQDTAAYASEPTSMPAAPSWSPSFTGSGTPAATAERRQVTILCCDLLDTSGDPDPETLFEAMPAFQELAKASIDRYDGRLASFVGHRLIAYFGYPRAHEDDPQRAANAALELASGVEALSQELGHPLATRGGIHTGPAVVSGGGDSGPLALGPSLDAATSVQAIARPGAVVVSDATRRLIDNGFVTEALEPVVLPGTTVTMPLFRVVAPRDLDDQAEGTDSPTPLVARDRELDLLLDRWNRARDGRGQVVLLSGDAGIGKSRLVRSLRDQVRDREDDLLWLRAYGSPYSQGSPLAPIADLVRRMLDIDPGGTTE